MSQMQTIEEYREGLREYFEYLIYLFEQWEQKPFRKVASKLKITWLYDAKRTISDFNMILKAEEEYWNAFLHEEAKLISSIDKKKVLEKEMLDFKQKITKYVEKAAIEAKQRIARLSIIKLNDLDTDRDKEIEEVLSTLKTMSELTFDDFLAMWKFRNKPIKDFNS